MQHLPEMQLWWAKLVSKQEMYPVPDPWFLYCSQDKLRNMAGRCSSFTEHWGQNAREEGIVSKDSTEGGNRSLMTYLCHHKKCLLWHKWQANTQRKISSMIKGSNRQLFDCSRHL